MKKPIGMTILAVGALLVTSCRAQISERQNQTEVKTIAPREVILRTVVSNSALPVQTKLIAPTVAEERRKQVSSGEKDPFAPLLVDPIIIPPAPLGGSDRIPPPSPPKIDPQPLTAEETQPSQIAVILPQESQRVPTMPALAPIETVRLPILTTPSLPPSSREESTATALETEEIATSPTEIASAVKVSGVIELGSGKKAIVQVPGEKTHRYVEAGEWLGQGKVQVKGIELDEMGAPVVILSENGQEVVKMVGSSRNSISGSFGWTN